MKYFKQRKGEVKSILELNLCLFLIDKRYI